MTLTGPVLLQPHHDLAGFDCTDDVLNSWLATKAGRNQTSGASRTWVVLDDDRVVGFYSSSTAVLSHNEASPRVRRNQPDPLPALLLARLAVDAKYQHEGVGAALLKHFLLKSWEVSQVTGVRVLLVHAKHDRAAAFYRRYDFDPSPVDELVLMLHVKDLAEAFR